VIILDTNVLSERYRSHPDDKVKRWFDLLPREQVSTTMITVAEMRYGAARLPRSRRRTDLENVIQQMVVEAFEGRIEIFDLAATAEYANLVAAREKAGRGIETGDAMIAAICLARRAALATRNIKDFEGLGIQLINPWES